MLSLLLITALAVQYPPPASNPAQDTTAPKRTTTAAPRGTSQAAVGRQTFHDRMRDLWSDHIVFTRNLIVSTTAGLPDTAEVLQRLLRNQDELGEAIKPYYGDAAGSQLASLLRGHIQLAGKALVAAKGSTPMQTGMHMNMQDPSISSRVSDTVASRPDMIRINSPNRRAPARRTDTTDVADTTKTKAKQYGNVRTDTTARANVYAQGQMQVQAGQADSVSLNEAIAALRANGDSIATFLNKANPRGFAREPLRGAFRMHIDMLLKQATAYVKHDWSGSVAAFDESQNQAQQMADMLSEGIMKQFPSRFNNKTTSVSTR